MNTLTYLGRFNVITDDPPLGRIVERVSAYAEPDGSVRCVLGGVNGSNVGNLWRDRPEQHGTSWTARLTDYGIRYVSTSVERTVFDEWVSIAATYLAEV